MHAKSLQSGIFSQKRTLGLKESRWDKLAKSKRAKIGVHSFAGSFASTVKPWQCDSPCRGFAVLDSVLIRDRRASIIAVTMAIQWQCKFSAQLCRTKSPTGHTVFFTGHTTTQLGAQWWSLSQCQLRCTCHIQESNIQSNLPTQTAEFIVEACHVFFHAVQHWL